MMARFSGDALAVTTHMIMIADCHLAKRKPILTRASEGERGRAFRVLGNYEFLRVIISELEGLLKFTIPLHQQRLTQFN